MVSIISNPPELCEAAVKLHKLQNGEVKKSRCYQEPVAELAYLILTLQSPILPRAKSAPTIPLRSFPFTPLEKLSLSAAGVTFKALR